MSSQLTRYITPGIMLQVCRLIIVRRREDGQHEIGTMSDHYEQWERACKEIRSENAALLEQFSTWLSSSGLSTKTVDRHVANVDFFVNEYLLYDDAVRPKDGWHMIDSFLGYWFIRKAMWASPASIRSNAASLKKFYRFLHENGIVDKVTLEAVRETTKTGLPEWLATLARYDDPDIDDPAEVWGL